MNAPTAWVEGVGLIGPGLADWEQARPVLAGRQPWVPAPTAMPPLDVLPAAERRRAGITVRVALAAGLQATRNAGSDAAQLASVFTSSGGDGQNCHEICAALATAERHISPTRFHNSVHNAASGYWGIATGATAASSALCACDGSFAAGLLEALLQVRAMGESVLLVAHDAPYPPPLHAARPIAHVFACALVLAPHRTAASMAQLTATLVAESPDTLTGPLEALRLAVPAARSLPLLTRLACGATACVVLDYLPDLQLRVTLQPCR